MQSRGNGNSNSGGSFQSALEENRRKAGVKNTQQRPNKQNGRKYEYADDNDEDDVKLEPVTQPKMAGGGGGLSNKFLSASIKTKLITVAGIIAAILMIIENLSPSQKEHDQGEHESAQPTANDPRQAIKSVAESTAPKQNQAQTVEQQVKRASSGSKNPLDDEVCDPEEKLKTMGTQWLPRDSYAGATSMYMKNKSDQIAFLDMKISGTLERSTTLVIMPGEAIKFPIAGIGTLGSVSSGTQWCNRRIGWRDNKTTPIRPAIIPTYDTTLVRGVVYDIGGGMLGVRTFLEKPGSKAPANYFD